MNTPILLAFVALAGWGVASFLTKVAGANQVYGPSYVIVSALAASLLGVIIHLLQNHSFELSAKMSGIAAIGGISAGIAFYANASCLSVGGPGKCHFPNWGTKHNRSRTPLLSCVP